MNSFRTIFFSCKIDASNSDVCVSVEAKKNKEKVENKNVVYDL